MDDEKAKVYCKNCKHCSMPSYGIYVHQTLKDMLCYHPAYSEKIISDNAYERVTHIKSMPIIEANASNDCPYWEEYVPHIKREDWQSLSNSIKSSDEIVVNYAERPSLWRRFINFNFN